MKKMFAIWLFLALGLFGTLYFIGVNLDKAYKDYRALEADMTEAASIYINVNKIKLKVGEKLTIKDKELQDSNLLPNMKIADDECKGYVSVKKTYDTYEYDAYIKCKNYTTVDYE